MNTNGIERERKRTGIAQLRAVLLVTNKQTAATTAAAAEPVAASQLSSLVGVCLQ